MGLTCGIVGLPNVGKSTVFNALTGLHAEASNYPFCTGVEPNRGKIRVPDDGLLVLQECLNPEKLIHADLEFLDVAGLVKGASQGEGLGNTFLGSLRAVDAIIHVVRMFEDPDIVHLPGDCEPVQDIGLIQTELILADLEVVERRIDKNRRLARTGQQEAVEELQHLEGIQKKLNEGVPLYRFVGKKEKDRAKYKEWGLLTDRPVLYVLNLGEDQISGQDRMVEAVKGRLNEEDAVFLPLCAKLEKEIMELDPEEREKFRKEMQWGPSGLERLIQDGFRLLDLITFYTIVGSVVRAWTFPKGETVYQAAGKIHSDMREGFIKAEVIPFEDFLRLRSEEKLRQEGLVHVEGKEYIVQDKDILRIRFH